MRKAGRLLDQVSERFDVIVANTGADWQETHAVLLERATRALFLVDQRTSSLRACKHALELCARCGIATGPFVFALNRCSKGALFTSIDVSCALEGAQVVELADGGRDVGDLLEMGSPDELLRTNNELAASLRCVLAGLLPSTAQGGFSPSEEARPSRGLFGLRRSRRRGGKHGVS